MSGLLGHGPEALITVPISRLLAGLMRRRERLISYVGRTESSVPVSILLNHLHLGLGVTGNVLRFDVGVILFCHG